MPEAVEAAPVQAAEPSLPTPDATASSEPVATPEPKRHLSKAERRAELVERLKLARDAKATKAADAPAEPAKADEPAADKPEPVAAKDADEKDTSDAKLEISKLKRAYKDARADLLEVKPQLDEYAALKADLEKAKGDPYHAVMVALPKLLGMDFGQMTQWMLANEDKFSEGKKYADLPPDVREEIEQSRKDRKERAEREARESTERAQAEKLTKYKEKIGDFLAANDDEFPIVAASDWAADDLAKSALHSKTKLDVKAEAAALEALAKKNLTRELKKEKVLSTLFTSDPELRALAAKLAGAPAATKSEKSQAVASLGNGDTQGAKDGPSTLTNRSAAADTSTPPRSATRSERVQRLVQRAAEIKAGRI